jgi:hydroxymethylglutaryl-CoA reductase
MEILKNPSAQELSEILVSIGLAQNFAALRALAVEGIQKGHMMLHARSVAQKAGVPKELIDIVCREMTLKKKYDVEEAKKIMVDIHRSRL